MGPSMRDGRGTWHSSVLFLRQWNCKTFTSKTKIKIKSWYEHQHEGLEKRDLAFIYFIFKTEWNYKIFKPKTKIIKIKSILNTVGCSVGSLKHLRYMFTRKFSNFPEWHYPSHLCDLENKSVSWKEFIYSNKVYILTSQNLERTE
jgi:hypothetical protein